MSEQSPPSSHAAGLTPEQLLQGANMMAASGHARALAMEVLEVEAGRAVARAPFRAELVGDPDTGIIAGGVVIALLDQISSIATFAAAPHLNSLATVDLRIDYMRGAKPGADIMVSAHCYKVGRNIAFVRAVAYDETPDEPVAHAVSTFMINSSEGREAGHNLSKNPSGNAG